MRRAPWYPRRQTRQESDVVGPTLIMTQAVVSSIDALLPRREDGEQQENVLYLAGVIEPLRRLALVIVAPRAQTGRGFYCTDRASHARVLNELGDVGLVVVGQIHCHPGREVMHSIADDDLAFVRAEGYWSLVVPHYGLRGMLPLRRCGVHRFTAGAFVRLTATAAERRVIIVPSVVDLTE